jgi:virginiamycin B lyase
MQLSNGKLWLAAFVLGLAASATAQPWINVVEYSVSAVKSYPQGIAAGPDGALWFTEIGANAIGRITTAGSVAAYPLPNADSQPAGITAGPDGALWFVEQYGNRIGRITTAGVITEYAVPTAASYPMGIAAGPDGALWFTECYGNNIGRAPACGLGLSASFANGTLAMNFDLGTSTPATWYGNLRTRFQTA